MDEALDLVLMNNELAKRYVGENIIWITTKEKMANILAKEEAEERRVEQKLEQERLKLLDLKKLKESSDVPVKQIMFELRIVEASHDFSEGLGLKGNFREGFNSGSSLGLNIDASLALAESEGKAKVLSAPRIIAKEGRAATLSGAFKAPATSTANNPSAREEYPLSLKMTPDEVSSDNLITLSVNVTKHSRNPLTKKSIDTTLIVNSGETVIAGVQENADNKAGVPSDSELIIFIKPTVLPRMGA